MSWSTLTAEQVRERIGRERAAAFEAVRQLLRRALEDDGA
jgi:predicted transcriptional regulator